MNRYNILLWILLVVAITSALIVGLDITQSAQKISNTKAPIPTVRLDAIKE